MTGPRGAFVALLLAACSPSPPDDLADGVLLLPGALHEVSGLCEVEPGLIACVQDEVGALFLVDVAGGGPPRALGFGERGDYEAVARVGADFWVLRSDGCLLRLGAAGGEYRIAASLWLPGGYREWEALCHDATRRRLLVMPKDGQGPDKDARDARPVFAVDPVAGVVEAAPLLMLSREGLIRQAAARGIELPTRTTGRGKERVAFELSCSELLAVPGTRELLVLSAADGLLLRIDDEGRLLACRRLDPALLPQAEGMAWLTDGRLVVASEGRTGAARLLVVSPP